MVFADKPPFDIFATSSFNAALLTSERGKSPIVGFIQLRKHPSHDWRVAMATGFRFRDFTCSIQNEACSLNLAPFFCFTTLLKYFSVSAPLSAMISRARCCRADADKTPLPEVGQILARLWARSSRPSTSIHHRTTHHLPLCSM